MSKMVQRATESENAKMVSKKVNYKTLTSKLSSDFELSSMSDMSGKIDEMSSLVDEYVDGLSNGIDCASSDMLNALEQSVSDLSDTVESEYAKKHTGTVTLAEKPDGADEAKIYT